MYYQTEEERRKLWHGMTVEWNIPASVLVEDIAVEALQRMDLFRRHTFLLFCGNGFTGAIGLALARLLYCRGKEVYVRMVGMREEMSEECERQYRILQKMPVEVSVLETLEGAQNLPRLFERVNTVIDALYGLEVHRELRGMPNIVIDAINESRVYTISIDLPSGLKADTGQCMGSCVEAAETFAIHKPNLALKNNEHVSGKVTILGNIFYEPEQH